MKGDESTKWADIKIILDTTAEVNVNSVMTILHCLDFRGMYTLEALLLEDVTKDKIVISNALKYVTIMKNSINVYGWDRCRFLHPTALRETEVYYYYNRYHKCKWGNQCRIPHPIWTHRVEENRNRNEENENRMSMNEWRCTNMIEMSNRAGCRMKQLKINQRNNGGHENKWNSMMVSDIDYPTN